MSCPQCFTGSTHYGETPSGLETKIHGLDTYVAEPPDGRTVKGLVVIVSDAFGWTFINNRILADKYAKKGGFRVYLPDFINGRAAPLWMIEMIPKAMETGSFLAWVLKPYHILQAIYGFVPFSIMNRFSISMPKVSSFINDIRLDKGSELPIGVAGFCWGGKHAFSLAHDPVSNSNSVLVDAVFAAHPSGLVIPDEIQEVKKPISVAIGDKDVVMSAPQVREVEDILSKTEGVESEVIVYPGAGHGFSVRADPTNENQSKQAAEAEDQAVNWFLKHFKNSEESI